MFHSAIIVKTQNQSTILNLCKHHGRRLPELGVDRLLVLPAVVVVRAADRCDARVAGRVQFVPAAEEEKRRVE